MQYSTQSLAQVLIEVPVSLQGMSGYLLCFLDSWEAFSITS